MKLSSPRAKLADCMWLARIWSKAKLLASNELPLSYEPFFCHPKGVDGQFLNFFAVDRDQIVGIAQLSAQEVENWFLGLPRVDSSRIEKWNHVAENLGRPGFPMHEQFKKGLATSYSHVAQSNPETIFDVLEADDRQAISDSGN